MVREGRSTGRFAAGSGTVYKMVGAEAARIPVREEGEEEMFGSTGHSNTKKIRNGTTATHSLTTPLHFLVSTCLTPSSLSGGGG